jgi:large subunit ribosomal protein L2
MIRERSCMKNSCWKGKPLKQLTFSLKKASAGRNSTGRITVFHRGSHAKRLQRRIDFQRNTSLTGKVERIEYDPNRSSWIALVRWYSGSTQPQHQRASTRFTYILACDKLKTGSPVMNNVHSFGNLEQALGNCVQLAYIPVGTLIHNIEWNPGQGAKFVRAAGTFAQLIQKHEATVRLRLPSGALASINSKCRATIGIVSNENHGKRNLRKAGQSRWLGRRPVVRGVAMNPVDHPHGGGEGRTKGGRRSVSPWGKPTKGGFKTVVRKQKN